MISFQHHYAERPAIVYSAMPTPTYDDFSTVSFSVWIKGTHTRIEADMPPATARLIAAELIAAAERVEAEQLAAIEASGQR